MLTEDCGELVVLPLHGGVVDFGEVSERVLVLAGLVGGDVRLEESDFRGVKAVGIAPSGEKGLGVVGLGVCLRFLERLEEFHVVADVDQAVLVRKGFLAVFVFNKV